MTSLCRLRFYDFWRGWFRVPDRLGTRRLVLPLGGVFLAFVVSRLLAYHAGVRFETFDFVFWHFIDPPLLISDLWGSLYHLHSQPPLFNLLLGIALRLPDPALFLHLLYLCSGLVLALALFFVLEESGVRPPYAAFWSGVFLTSPACILYENFLFPTYPALAVISSACVFFLRFLRTRRVFWFALFCFSLMILCYLRNMFQLPYYLLAAGLLVFKAFAMKKSVRFRMGILSGFLLPFLGLSALYVKNYLEFGVFVSSSWYGMQLARASTFLLPERERRLLVESGGLSSLALRRPFAPLAAYGVSSPPTGVPLLDLREKSSGEANLHNIAYIDISRRYFEDARRTVLREPLRYAGGVLLTYLGFYLRAPSDFHPLYENRKRIEKYDRLYYDILYGRPPADSCGTNIACLALNMRGLFLILGYSALPFVGLWWLFSCYRRGRDVSFPLFLLGTLFYVLLVGNAFEHGENQRFRFLVSPVFFIIALLSLRGAAGRR